MNAASLGACLMMMATAPEMRHVTADVARVRAKPDAQARVVGRLRIGTPVTVLAEQDQWVHVQTPRVDGWAAREFLGAAPDPADLKQRAEAALAAGDLKAAAIWADRWTALRPDAADAWRLSAQVHGKLGDPKAALQAEQKATAGEPVLLGWCNGARAMLFAKVEPNGELTALTDERDQMPASLPRYFDDVTSSAWFMLDTPAQERASKVEGSPFARPFVTTVWNEESATAVEPAAPDPPRDGLEGGSKVVMGPCSVPGALLTSAPAVTERLQPTDAPPARVLKGLVRTSTWSKHQVVGNERWLLPGTPNSLFILHGTNVMVGHMDVDFVDASKWTILDGNGNAALRFGADIARAYGWSEDSLTMVLRESRLRASEVYWVHHALGPAESALRIGVIPSWPTQDEHRDGISNWRSLVVVTVDQRGLVRVVVASLQRYGC